MQILQFIQRSKLLSEIWKKPAIFISLRQPLTTCITAKDHRTHFKSSIFTRRIIGEYKSMEKLLKRSQISWISLCSLHINSHRYQQATGGSTPESSSNDPNDDEEKKQNEFQKNIIRKITLSIFALYLISSFGSLFSDQGLVDNDQEQSIKIISYNEFVNQYLSKGEVEEITIDPLLNTATITLYNDSIIRNKKITKRHCRINITDVQEFEDRLHHTEDVLNIRPDQRVPVVYNRGMNNAGNEFLIAALILIGIMAYLSKNISLGSIPKTFQMTRAKFTAIDPLIPGSGKGVKFSDVAGSEQAKIEVLEFVEFLRNPVRYKKLGAKVPKGALLLGPPGCGKTLLAKAVATEGQVPFLAMNGPEFIEMIGGVGAARVRDLFKEAQNRAPCIIYIDEIDAIGRKRSSAMSTGSEESEQTLNQLLTEMDGLLSKEGVILLASTNRLDILDQALLRPGRFDRHIMMELPTLIERQQIFDHHLKSIILENGAASYSKRLAYLTLGFSGADIANVVNEAALHAARNAQVIVKASNLEYAVERMVGGTEKRSQTLSTEEKRMIAFHESGHALVGWLLEHTDTLVKVTIVPRTSGAGGFSHVAPTEKYLYDQNEIFERMCRILGGRVAESIVFNRITTSSQDDLEKVTKLAYSQVRTYGFSDKVGQLSYPEESDEDRTKRSKKFYSQKLAMTIDTEASKLVFEAYQATEKLLKKNVDKLKVLAESLIEKETLSYEDIEALIGPPTYGSKMAAAENHFPKI